MRTLAAVAVLLLVAACQAPPPPEMTEGERAQIQAEVVQVWENHFQVMETKDCSKLAETYHPEHLAMAYGGRLFGSEDWDEVCNDFFDGIEAWTGFWAETEVRVLTRDLAVLTGFYGDTIRYSSGRVVTWPGNCAQVSLLERTEDGWKTSIWGQSCGPSQAVEEG